MKCSHSCPRIRRLGYSILVGLFFALTGVVHGAERQLYALSGQPLSDYIATFPVVLYRVEEGGLTKMRTVITRKQDAIVVKAYPEDGFVLVVSHGATRGSFLVDVLDIDAMSHERSVDFDVCDGCSYIVSHLLKKDGRLIFYIRARGDDITRNLGLDLESGEFLDDIDRGDDSYAHTTGSPPGFVDGNEHIGGIYVRDHAPDQPYLMRDPDTFDLDWSLPAWFDMPKGGRLKQTANNEHLRVLLRSGDPQERLVFEKRTQRWSRIPLAQFPSGRVRAFRHWLVQEVARPGFDEDTLDVELLDSHRSEPFLSASQRLRHREVTPTGRLLFYDTRSGTSIQYDTHQPDSEVLLIDEDEAVYFRVSDELRRARLVDGGLASEEVVARAPELWGVHWLVTGFD